MIPHMPSRFWSSLFPFRFVFSVRRHSRELAADLCFLLYSWALSILFSPRYSPPRGNSPSLSTWKFTCCFKSCHVFSGHPPFFDVQPVPAWRYFPRARFLTARAALLFAGTSQALLVSQFGRFLFPGLAGLSSERGLVPPLSHPFTCPCRLCHSFFETPGSSSALMIFLPDFPLRLIPLVELYAYAASKAPSSTFPSSVVHLSTIVLSPPGPLPPSWPLFPHRYISPSLF